MAGPALLDFPTYYALIALHADYAAVLDAGEWERWPEFFLEDGVYKLQPRENYDRGLPLATIALESKGMLRDRVYGIRETLYHDPYYQRHVTGVPLIRGIEGETILTETSYAVFRTKQDQLSEVMNIGRYLDRVQPTAEGLKFAARLCIFDSEMIPNSVIYPI